MAHILTETPTHTATVTVPDDGDDLTAASVQAAFQALANRTDLANKRLTGDLYMGDILATSVTAGAVNAEDPSVFSGLLTAAGGLRLSASLGGNAATSISPRNSNIWHCPPFTADRDYTIDDTNCVDGDWLIIVNNGSNYACNVVFGSDTLLSLSRNGSGPAGNGRYVAAMFHRFGGGWAPGLRSIGGTNQTIEYAPSASAAIGASAVNRIYVIGGLSATANYTLSDASADNSWVTFMSVDGDYIANVKNGSGVSIATLSGLGIEPNHRWATCRKLAGTWIVVERGR